LGRRLASPTTAAEPIHYEQSPVSLLGHVSNGVIPLNQQITGMNHTVDTSGFMAGSGVRREFPDSGLREFLIYELHIFALVSYLILGKSQALHQGTRGRKMFASQPQRRNP
jgi:hypothetical protein